jgi:flavin reductase (DIM6/NTAB) family NADH-FMN oxidoreductase RutF
MQYTENNWKTWRPEDCTVGEFHSYMLACVGPRPIAFVSTLDAEGRPNLAPFSFFNVFGTNPATLIFSPARRGRDNTTKHTLHNVEALPECVVNVVNYPIVEQMSLASTEFEEGVNEFEKAGFTALQSQFVKPFRVAESPAAFECRVEQVVHTGNQGGAGNLVICRILALHINKQFLDANEKVKQAELDLVGRMGYEFYCRADAQSIFEVPKPRKKDAIGFDGLPVSIRESEFLNGNELARLAACSRLFSEEEIQSNLILLNETERTKAKLILKVKDELQKTNFETALLYAQCAYFAK